MAGMESDVGQGQNSNGRLRGTAPSCIFLERIGTSALILPPGNPGKRPPFMPIMAFRLIDP